MLVIMKLEMLTASLNRKVIVSEVMLRENASRAGGVESGMNSFTNIASVDTIAITGRLDTSLTSSEVTTI